MQIINNFYFDFQEFFENYPKENDGIPRNIIFITQDTNPGYYTYSY